jgi:hypothetical protein
MNEVDGVIISSIHRITGNEYFKQLFLRQSQSCFSARSAKEPSTQKSRLWDFLSKMGRFSPLQYDGNKSCEVPISFRVISFPHPSIFNILRLAIVVIWMHEVLFMNDDLVIVYPPPRFSILR